jgi:hypothetical protein
VRVVTAVTIAAVAITAAACGRDDEPVTRPSARFCTAAEKLDDGLSGGDLDIDGQIRLVRRMAAAAPAEIEAEVRVFLAALERIRDDPGDRDARDDPEVDDPEVKDAVDAVNRYAIDGCGLLEGDSPF